jgi:hypothetical protein
MMGLDVATVGDRWFSNRAFEYRRDSNMIFLPPPLYLFQ